MKISEFATEVTKTEGGKKEITVAQVSEVLRIVNEKLFGIPYFLIRLRRKK